MRKSDTTQARMRYLTIFILLSIVAGASWALSAGNLLFVFGLILSGAAVIYFHRQRQKNRFKDERIQHIYYLTSWATLQLSVLSFAFVGAFLISVRSSYPQYSTFGFHLAYISCGILVMYTLFHIYFSKKYGA